MNEVGRLSVRVGRLRITLILQTLKNFLSGSMDILTNLFPGKAVISRTRMRKYREGYINGTVMFKRLGSVHIPPYLLKEVESYGKEYAQGFIDGWLDAYNAVRRKEEGKEKGKKTRNKGNG